MRNILGLILLSFVCQSVNAQKSLHNSKSKVIINILKQYSDSLSTLMQKYNKWEYAKDDTLSNPYYFRLFFRPTFYSSPVKNKMQAEWKPEEMVKWKAAMLGIVDEGTYKQEDYMDDILTDLYTQNPQYVSGTESDLQKNDGLRSDLDKDIHHEVKFAEKVETPYSDILPGDFSIVVHKPNFWTFSGNFSLQFTQNYISDNWYKGGESNNSLLTACVLRANYNNKQKIRFENTLEMKLGFQSSRNDDLHKYKTYSDQLRLTNKLGLQASKHWYYTVLLQSWTQFHPGYRNNDKKVYSDFMSPFESVFSVGMDYRLGIKNFSLSANIAPLAYDLKYVDRDALTSAYNVYNKSHIKAAFGSNVTVNYSWKIINNVSWYGRIYYFSNYKYSMIEWENTFDLMINKYLSTKIFLFPRFDDNGKKGDDGYLQFKEWLSLGLNLSF
ncbi:MAG: DUF3078 domain-containing protein [Bacteroidaceae bacterium]